jgi:hypothetical protein
LWGCICAYQEALEIWIVEQMPQNAQNECFMRRKCFNTCEYPIADAIMSYFLCPWLSAWRLSGCNSLFILRSYYGFCELQTNWSWWTLSSIKNSIKRILWLCCYKDKLKSIINSKIWIQISLRPKYFPWNFIFSFIATFPIFKWKSL